jgi:transposase, IS30 family
MPRQRRKLTVEERVAIDLRRKDGWGVRAIARELGRSPSVISTEIGRGREPGGNYAAGPAQAAAAARRGTPGWQPAVCRGGEAAAAAAGADRREASGGWNGNVVRTPSEAISQAVYAVPRGELRRELLACQGKPHRGPRMATGGAGSATSSANGRRRWRVPGHWEGDLIKGNRSSVGTLVQPQADQADGRQGGDGTRWLRLLAVPAPLRLTLTYDQGKEMARHRELAALTGLRVYFAHAPWQRGSNENTKGLLRQYLPKGTDLSVFSQAELDAIATRLNRRKTLGFATPDEVFAALVDKAANAVTAPNAEGVRYGT